MTKRERVFAKYGGKCAYTGQPLGNDWQIDHLVPVIRIRKNKYCKMELSEEDKAWNKRCENIENLMPACRIVNHYKFCDSLEQFRKIIMTLQSRIDKMPVWLREDLKYEQRLRNQYEAAGMTYDPFKDLSPYRTKTKKRFLYIMQVAQLFGITQKTPFSGKFYFETLTASNGTTGENP